MTLGDCRDLCERRTTPVCVGRTRNRWPRSSHSHVAGEGDATAPTDDTGAMTTLLAKAIVKPGMESQWEELARAVFPPTHEHEDGCKHYEYWRGSDPRTYYVLLAFDDFDAFMSHQVADHHHDQGFATISRSSRWSSSTQFRVHRPLGPSETGGQERPDATDVWNTYVRNHSKPTPEWWLPLRG